MKRSFHCGGHLADSTDQSGHPDALYRYVFFVRESVRTLEVNQSHMIVFGSVNAVR